MTNTININESEYVKLKADAERFNFLMNEVSFAIDRNPIKRLVEFRYWGTKDEVIEAIDPKKDVDGFHPINIGRMAKGLPSYISATPYGVLELIKRYKIETAGKHCVVVGRSQIVGLPMSILMQRNTYPGNCTVTLVHSRTQNLKEMCLQADILVAALGKPEFITADMVKDGAVVIDVGLTRVVDESKKSGFALKGDVKFDEVAPKTSFITPVPGGVGLMTVAALMYNTLLASRKEIYG